MPALEPTDYFGTITWLGAVMSRPKIEVETKVLQTLTCGWDGLEGAAHTGRTRPSDSRVLGQHALGTEIANVRQLSLVGRQDIEDIRRDMGLDAFDPRWLGANIVIDGLGDFSHLPPSARLQAENGTTMIVDMQNFPCHQIGKTIELDRPGQGKSFKQHAKGRRGVTAWIERPGTLNIGDTLRLHLPSQRAWAPD